MWLQDFIKTGTPVARRDNPAQTGVCIAVDGFDGRSLQTASAASYRIVWDVVGWREDCTFDEIVRTFQ